MAPTKEDDDPVTAEYDVYITPAIADQILLLQYPNRPRNRPYSANYGAVPTDMRIKPHSGYMEVDVALNTQQNFNKYMGLKWGDATRASHELHNATGTFGPAAGLAGAKPRSMARGTNLKDKSDRELDFENDLTHFPDAERENKVHAVQTLGGQILRHDGPTEEGKPFYFVGAFKDDQLHLTRVAGTVQMRPHFHHLDAEEQRARITASRAQQDAAGPEPEGIARTVRQKVLQTEDKNTVEWKLKESLRKAKEEKWIEMDYVDEDESQAFDAFETRLKIQDVSAVPHLKSEMDNDAFLDAVGSSRHESPTRRRKRQPKRRDTIDLDEEDAEAEAAEAIAERD
ncbi:uncharacterized protein RCC_06604 [Ramularia collo-cygni]|uniref:Uncharacterized protein n=1 Tax=Ramularia collo-cygni TaxID=112498 RepID=A0A2D3VAQ6_9PEZI|nr:uncharacterized protein RCC_06604 [Ramularia collo-cygni]CZT20746.1 uncharacterized protein RCC_06604 [Ramularia collo-cygni]